MSSPPYIGRFAPSPSGPLHFGSLVTALASFLQARSQQGQWQVRIEDIDPLRDVAGAATQILRQLEQYGLFWDGDVVWQSQRHEAYRSAVDWLRQYRQSYYCCCSRKRIQQKGGIYDGYCRQQQYGPVNAALRLRQSEPVKEFTDLLRGKIVVTHPQATEDFIIRRRDGLFSYNLAVVVDDNFQSITEVVRGADLVTPTVRQIALYQQFGWHVPAWLHLPLALHDDGKKLSKQNHAPPLPTGDARPVLIRALQFLGQKKPSDWQDAPLDSLLKHAIQYWDPADIPVCDIVTD